MSQFIALIRKDISLELRQGYAISGLLVYVLATVFIVYISFVEIAVEIWNILYWIIFLFVALTAVLKSFLHESSDRYLYYYSLVSPSRLLWAKAFYNTFILLLLGILLFLGLSVVTNFPVVDPALFLVCIFLASLGISLSFTLISSIAIKADNSVTLMAILSIPVIIPILLNLVRLSSVAMGLRMDDNIYNEIFMLLSLDALMLGLGILLFPFLWKA